jgi:undecaprenyl diphosphate synthase
MKSFTNSPKVPVHVAIIPDGNRRFAESQGIAKVLGHARGYERTKDLIAHARSVGIQVLTLWAFSTENWAREEGEVVDLLALIKRGLLELQRESRIQKTRLVHIGRRDRLGGEIIRLLETIEDETKEYTDFCLCIAIDYGGEDEVKRAVELLRGDQSGSMKSVVDYLDTSRANIPPPDLIIRTGGEKRTSGFLPLQSAYAEWVFEKVMFPDFDTILFQKALDEYTFRTRRFGR